MADDTLAELFWSRVARGGDRPAQQFKRDGGWESLTWRQLGEVVRELALGLIALGRQRGDAVALLSTSRAEWVQADFAIFSAGCVTIPIYPSYPPDLVAYIVNDSGAKTLIVEDHVQEARVLEVRGKMGGLEQVVVMAGGDGRRGNGGTLGWEALRRLGREGAEHKPATARPCAQEPRTAPRMFRPSVPRTPERILGQSEESAKFRALPHFW